MRLSCAPLDQLCQALEASVRGPPKQFLAVGHCRLVSGIYSLAIRAELRQRNGLRGARVATDRRRGGRSVRRRAAIMADYRFPRHLQLACVAQLQ